MDNINQAERKRGDAKASPFVKRFIFLRDLLYMFFKD
jgi:hypothetical protein